MLPIDVYQRLLSDVPMTRTDTLLTAFGNSKIHPEGEVKLEVKCPETSITKLLSFYVTSASDIAILGCKACTAMNLVTRVAIDSVCNTTVLTKDSLLEIYGDVFTGIGEYKKPYHIKVDNSVPPVIQHCRKVPYARYDNLKQTLSDLEKKGIVASVDRPTDWVHNLVITEKRDGRMRVCLDPKPLNKAIKRERYEIPTPSDVHSRLSGMKIFTVIDMKDGYWHVKLSEESSYLCTFHTPWGRRRFLRMPFSISSASDVMQKRNEEAFSDIQGVKRSNDEGRDPYLALLAYRNRAVAGMSFSPAQMLMSRSLNTKVPTLPSFLQPKVVDARPQLEQRQQRHKAVFDRGAHELTELHPGDVVRVRHNNVWQPAIVREKDIHPRSYIIERDGCRLRRNRRQLLKTAEDESPTTTSEVADACLAQPADVVEPNKAPSPMPVVQRDDVPRTPGRVRSSGRTVVRPVRFEDYHM